MPWSMEHGATMSHEHEHDDDELMSHKLTPYMMHVINLINKRQ